MSVEIALESEDLKLVKKYRGVLKGQLTVSLNKLEKILANKLGDDFDHSSISKSEVKQVGAKLTTNFDLFIKLHDKCCLLRESGKNDEEELTLAEKDSEYTDSITDKYYPMQDLIEKYNCSLADFEAKKAELKSAQKKQSC